MHNLTIFFLILITLGLGLPAAAVEDGVPGQAPISVQHFGDRPVAYSTFGRTNVQGVPPQMDVLVLRPTALAGLAIVTPAFIVGAPFAALAGDLDVFYRSTIGDVATFVFMDPIGSH